jgi:putative transposon-encoded protein
MSETKYAKRVTPMGIPHTRLDDLPDLIEVQRRFERRVTFFLSY